MTQVWYHYNFLIALSTNSEETSCVNLFSKQVFTEKELKQIVLKTFNDNKEELIFKGDHDEKLINTLILCKLIERNNSKLRTEMDECFINFDKLEVSK